MFLLIKKNKIKQALFRYKFHSKKFHIFFDLLKKIVFCVRIFLFQYKNNNNCKLKDYVELILEFKYK